ncbi:type I polyketide synthase [Nocardia sp. BMG51109]|uniref:type I polyketide synthase n=1 Tax=Nocardia sp. BMG51109 TaxID=1056816 RepID=UPI000464A183|nr:type I polyketide synthase [Nocardia sp. BMG51109]
MSTEGSIAIVGMAARFPGAPNVGRFWANLRAGADTVHRFRPDELADPAAARHPDYVPARGVLPGGDQFDWQFFGYSPAEAALIDPQQRVLLECASEAVDDAGVDPRRFPGWIGVFAGSDPVLLDLDGDTDVMAQVLGRDKDYLATRIAYKLGLRGPAVTVQSACSTALTAVHSACQSLLGYECDVALAGGVAVSLPQQRGYFHQEGGILSRDGRCRPFDAEADGTVASEGAGIVVLKRLSDALTDGDRIVAVVRGSAINNDGSDKIGYTAPSVTGQRDVIRLALAQAEIDPADLGYVEAHGTATRIGDPVEVQALTEAFRESTPARRYCLLGSVKSNIGHAGAAAGIAGLIKAALQLEHGEIAPTVHFRQPNPLLALDDTPFRIAAEHQPWPERAARLAGISSFGIGGTNVHAVLAAPPDRDRAAEQSRPRLFVLSTKTSEALAGLRDAVADRLESAPCPRLDDVSATLAGRRRLTHRIAVVAHDRARLTDRLRADRVPTQIVETPRVAFLFPGQSTLAAGAAVAAYRRLPSFRHYFDETAATARRDHAVDLSPLVTEGADPGWFRDTVNQQLGLFALGYGLGCQFREWAVTPAAMLGNSIGEYIAATLAGLWSLPDAITVIHRRAAAMRATPAGRMLAVAAPAADLEARLGSRADVVVAVRGPGTTVLSGARDAIDAVLTSGALDDLQVRTVDTEQAFHSPLMATAADQVRTAVAAVPTETPTLPLVSGLTGTWARPDRLRDPGYWAEHLLRPMRLDDGVGVLLADRCDTFVELGPGSSMIGTLRRHPDWSADRLAMPLLGKPADATEQTLLHALGVLWERGLDIPLEQTTGDDRPQRCALPPVPFAPLVPPRRTTVPGPDRSVAATGVTTDAWAQVRTGAVERHSGIVVTGESDGLVTALAAPNAAIRCVPAISAIGEYLDETTTAVLVMLPTDATDATVDQLDASADALAALGIRLMVAGRGLTAISPADTAAAVATSIESWIRCRRDKPGDVTVLDLGTEAPPDRVPAPAGRTALLARRDGRWWQWTALPVATERAARPGTGRVAIVSAGRADGVRIAETVAAAGVPVSAYADTDAPASMLPLAEHLPTAMAGAARAEIAADRLSARADLRNHLDLFSAGLVGRFVLRFGKVEPGSVIDAAVLRSRLDPQDMLPKFIDFMLRVLTEQGWLAWGSNGVRMCADMAEQVDRALRAGNDLDELSGLRRLLDHCAASYPAVFSGTMERVSVLYPEGDPTLFRDSLTDNRINPSGDVVVCMDTVRRAIHAAAHGATGTLRILEIGAGNAELTWPLLDGWDTDTALEYYFTDISPLLLRRAAQRADELGLADRMRFARYDLTRDPTEQGLPGGTFDIVLAYNAVHVAPDVRTVLGHLAGLLRPGGSLCFIEMTAVSRWAHVLWGLTPGWWDFGPDRTDAIMLARPAWTAALTETGFTGVSVHASGEDADHAVLIGSIPATDHLPPVERAVEQLRGRDFDNVLYLPLGPDAARTWTQLLRSPAVSGRGYVVTQDDPAGGWRAERWRRELDPVDELDPGWHHVRVARLATDESAALPALLSDDRLPGTVRLAPPPARAQAPAAPEPNPVTTTAPAAPHDPLRDRLTALWCDVLGVPAVTDDDDFFALGGESLMAVHFMGRIRARTGINVPTATFTRAPTFGRLLDLARQSAGDSAETTGSDPHLVVLRDGGPRTPLFLAAPAAGTTLSYRALAGLLDDRPVYGIEPELTARGETTVEDIAAHHLEAIRRVRPHGPYLLGGWSFGAVVAHEIARRLRELGERVEMLVCIDGYVPDTHGQPIRSLRGFHGIGLWYQATAALRVGAAGALVRDAPDVRRVFSDNIRAMWRYRPRPVDCAVLVLKTRLDPVRARWLRRELASLYAGDVIVRPVGGRHWTVLEEPHVRQVAEELRTALARRHPISTGAHA